MENGELHFETYNRCMLGCFGNTPECLLVSQEWVRASQERV
jgi:hypothetical protein